MKDTTELPWAAGGPNSTREQVPNLQRRAPCEKPEKGPGERVLAGELSGEEERSERKTFASEDQGQKQWEPQPWL